MTHRAQDELGEASGAEVGGRLVFNLEPAYAVMRAIGCIAYEGYPGGEATAQGGSLEPGGQMDAAASVRHC